MDHTLWGGGRGMSCCRKLAGDLTSFLLEGPSGPRQALSSSY